MCVVLDTPVGQLGVYCTHLDHMHESTRLQQLQQLLQFLQDNHLHTIPHLLVGDFNSLGHASDYSPKQWQHIVDTRAQNSWESPKVQVIPLLEKHGYIDACKEAGGDPSQPTCWAGSRIDYIFKSAQCPWQAIAHTVAPSNASDHNLVLVQFKYLQ